MLTESSVRHKFRFEDYVALFERRAMPNNDESEADSIRNTAVAAELQKVAGLAAACAANSPSVQALL